MGAIKARHARYASALTHAMDQVNKNYVAPVDFRTLFQNAMAGMLEHLDPHSTYVPERELQQLDATLDQEFGGVGLILSLDRASQRLVVLSAIAGRPAYRAGIQPGDVVLQINQTDAEGMSVQDASRLIRGAAGTEVQLTVQHLGDQSTQQLKMLREVIEIESVLGDVRRAAPDDPLADGWIFFLQPSHPQIAYLRITTFGTRTAEELTAALSQVVPTAQGLVLDLRGNAGGLLTAAVEVCDKFVDQGVLVSTRGRGGVLKKAYKASPSATEVPPQLPVVVLIDQYSASASEIVAACLQDHQRATVIGQRSWGKGTVQNLIYLDGGRSAMKLTTATYWRPSGRDIHRHEGATDSDDWGVRPDFEVRLSDAEYERLWQARRQRDLVASTQLEDPPLQRAVEQLKLRGSASRASERAAETNRTDVLDEELSR